jgi:hypothetical protein
MRRLSGLVVAGAMLLLALFAQAGFAQDAAPQKFTLEGDLALWTVLIRPDKTADYEQVLNRLKEVLRKSESAEAKRQAAGWRVYRAAKPHTDGNIIYTHVITPVPGADYAPLQVLYQTVTDPAQQKELYDLYRGAFVGNLGLSSWSLAVDFSN